MLRNACCGEHGFAVIDTETTGLSPIRDRVVEVAVCLLDAHLSPERKWVSLVRPPCHPGAYRVHGLSASDLINAPPFAGVAAEVVDLMRDRIIVGHNVTFDLAMLSWELRRIGWSLPAMIGRADTMYQPHAGQTRAVKLARLAAFHGTDPPNHRAMSDVEACTQVFRAQRDIAHSHGRHLVFKTC